LARGMAPFYPVPPALPIRTMARTAWSGAINFRLVADFGESRPGHEVVDVKRRCKPPLGAISSVRLRRDAVTAGARGLPPRLDAGKRQKSGQEDVPIVVEVR
jgi:hypothetical protein